MNKRKTGTYYEEAVAEYLKAQGVTILYKNFRCSYGEIDLIGQYRDTTIFFEIKFRKNERYGNPLEAVTIQKQKTICRCAAFFCLQHKEVKQIRYDVIGITDTEIKWIQNAFEHKGYAFV